VPGRGEAFARPIRSTKAQL